MPSYEWWRWDGNRGPPEAVCCLLPLQVRARARGRGSKECLTVYFCPLQLMRMHLLDHRRQWCSLGEGTLPFLRCALLRPTELSLSSNFSNIRSSIQIAAPLAAFLKSQKDPCAIIREESLEHWPFCFMSPQLQSSWKSQVNLNMASHALKSPSNVELALGFLDPASCWISMS